MQPCPYQQYDWQQGPEQGTHVLGVISSIYDFAFIEHFWPDSFVYVKVPESPGRVQRYVPWIVTTTEHGRSTYAAVEVT